MTGSFLEATWFPWWLFAIAIIGWWSWRLIANDSYRFRAKNVHWKNLYRQALSEKDETKLGVRIQEAEGAILLQLASHVFVRNNKERVALQEAISSLHSLRQTHPQDPTKADSPPSANAKEHAGQNPA